MSYSSVKAGEQHHRPGRAGQQAGQHHGRRAEVLGVLGQGVAFQRDAVHHGLDGRIDQLVAEVARLTKIIQADPDQWE